MRFECIKAPNVDEDALAIAVERALLRVEAEAKRNLTIVGSQSTGQLRMSIQTNVKRKHNKIIGEVGTNLDYAPYIEFGTGIYASPLGPGSKAKRIPWVYPTNKLSAFGKAMNKIKKKLGMETQDTEFYTTWGQPPKLYMYNAWEKEKSNVERQIMEALNGNKSN